MKLIKRLVIAAKKEMSGICPDSVFRLSIQDITAGGMILHEAMIVPVFSGVPLRNYNDEL
jgi:hypothetical protein